MVSLIQDKVGYSSAPVVTTGRTGVRRMRSRKSENFCIRVTRISWTPIFRNTLTLFRTPSLCSAWLGESSISICFIW